MVGKGLGVYRAHIDPKDSKQLFVKALPKKYHTKFHDRQFEDGEVEQWLHTLIEGEEWERTNLRQQLTHKLGTDKTIRFMKVDDMKPVYKQKKMDYKTKKTTKVRKNKMLQELVQVPHVKYSVGSPAYIQAMQKFQTSAKRLMK